MLLPIINTAAALGGQAIIFFGQERDMPHGLFGDRDARVPATAPRIPAFCGLFGRRGDAPAPRPADDNDRATIKQATRGRA